MNKFIIVAMLLLIGGTIIFTENINKTKTSMKIESSAFQNNSKIPAKYTCDGADVNPPLNISGVPKDTKSLALVVDDPDAQIGVFTHWTIWNMDPSTKEIAENSVPNGIEGKTDFGESGYGGPCPSSGTHRYFFKLYALDAVLSIPKNSDKKTLEAAMNNHVLSSAELVGLYGRE